MSTPADVTLAQEMYNLYIAAEKAVLTGQAYSIGDRTLTRVDLRWIAEERKKWGDQLEKLELGNRGPRVQRVIPRGFN